MKMLSSKPRRTSAAVFAWCGTLALLVMLACESVAGVADVSFNGAQTTGLTCASYCEALNESCRGDLAVYEDANTCLEACSHFELGKLSAENTPAGNTPPVNTVACRLDQALKAASSEVPVEKQEHCHFAGPGGGSRCASSSDAPDCEGYCTLYIGACASISKDWGFGSHAECVRKCAAIPPLTDYSVATAANTGDSLACRLYYASAAVLDPDAHCKNASLRPAGPCLGDNATEPSCTDYCRAIDVACTGQLKVYETRNQCLSVCKELEPGSRTDTGKVDSVGCRVSHTYNALLIDPPTHCPHAGPMGDGVCSAAVDPNCVPFCRLAQAACSEQFQEAFSDSGCLEQCRALSDSAAHNAYSVATAQSGDTLKCRMLHAARALTQPASKQDLCPAVFGAAPCN